MKTASLNLPRLLFLLAALLFAGAGNAHAKRVPKLFTFGDDFYDLGAPKGGDGAELATEGVKVGYHCQAFGLFWVNIFTWSGEYCLYKGSGLETKHYEPISQEDAAKLLGVAKVGKPWNYSFPPGMIVLIGLVGLKVVPRLLAKKRAAAFNAPSASAPTQSWHGGGMVPSRPAPPVGQSPQAPESYAPPQTPPPVPPPLPPDQQ